MGLVPSKNAIKAIPAQIVNHIDVVSAVFACISRLGGFSNLTYHASEMIMHPRLPNPQVIIDEMPDILGAGIVPLALGFALDIVAGEGKDRSSAIAKYSNPLIKYAVGAIGGTAIAHIISQAHNPQQPLSPSGSSIPSTATSSTASVWKVNTASSSTSTNASKMLVTAHESYALPSK